MLLVVTNTYVDESHPYENSFVHSRILSYHRNGIPAEVFVVNNKRKKRIYEFEGVRVQVGSVDGFVRRIDTEQNPSLCIHFLTRDIVSGLNAVRKKLNILIFVHGVEALRWNERLFPGIFATPKMCLGFLKYAITNGRSLRIYRNFFNNTKHHCEFVTVSEWMRDMAEKNWGFNGRFKWNIIPNYVDEKRFPYKEKSENSARRILTIRQFSSGKYANDISVKVVLLLMKDPVFSNLKISFVGDGILFKKTMKPLEGIKNVSIERRLLPQSEIPDYHQRNGIFLCPTRQDAQGVSMCEAMSSGLVPVTLYNTAIPEFLPNDKRLICHTPEEMAKLIISLIEHPHEFRELSKICSSFIHEKCGAENTTCRELEIIKSFR